MFEKLRSKVLKSAASEKAGLIKDRKLRLVRKLVAHYGKSPGQVEQDYLTLMVFGGRSDEEVAAEVETAAQNPAGKTQKLVMLMVSTDERSARQLLLGRRVEERMSSSDLIQR